MINLLVLKWSTIDHKKRSRQRREEKRKQESWGRLGRWKLIRKVFKEGLQLREDLSLRLKAIRVGKWSPQLKKSFTKGEELDCHSCSCIIWNYSTDKASVHPSQKTNTNFKSIISFCRFGGPFCKILLLLLLFPFSCFGEPYCKLLSPLYLQLCMHAHALARSLCHKDNTKKCWM